MDLFTIVLMLSAGLLHAGWHSLVKSGSDQLTILAGMGIVAVLAALAALPFLAPPPAAIWPVMLLSVVLHVGYKLCLSSAYARGDLGQAFPLARGVVPLFATLIAFWALKQVPSPAQAVGIALISCGLIVLAFDRAGAPTNWPLLAAAGGAGAAVAGYSVLDSYGTRLYGDWAGFTGWLIVCDNVTFLMIGRMLRGPEIWRELKVARLRVTFSGLLGLGSFCVFLWALSRSPVGPVSALRETSVLFAVAIGVLLHREVLSVRRIGAGALVLAGIVTIAI